MTLEELSDSVCAGGEKWTLRLELLGGWREGMWIRLKMKLRSKRSKRYNVRKKERIPVFYLRSRDFSPDWSI